MYTLFLPATAYPGCVGQEGTLNLYHRDRLLLVKTVCLIVTYRICAR